MVEQNKKNHHFIPKMYLSGFVDSKTPGKIWLYDIDRPFTRPGKNARPNPINRTVKLAGAIQDFYSLINKDSTLDSNTYENLLEKLEKPADRVLMKVRQRKIDTLSTPDKTTLAKYIVHLHKRVPRAFDKGTANWDNFINNYLEHFVAILHVKFPFMPEELLRREVKKYSQRPNVARNAILDSITQTTELLPELVNVLLKKHWRFLISPPEHHPFICSDNPVAFSEELGARKSEITLPISSRLALHMSAGPSSLSEELLIASSKEIHAMNIRTASIATKHLYCEEKAEWVLKLLRT